MLKIFVVGFIVCALGVPVRGQTTAPATTQSDSAPLVITAAPDAATLHPGESFKFDVVIRNVSTIEQRIDLPNIAWAATTDVPQVMIRGWPRRAGHGPVVTFHSVTIAAGESYKHSWSADVSPEAEAGEISLRVGVPLHRGGDKTWSGHGEVEDCVRRNGSQGS